MVELFVIDKYINDHEGDTKVEGDQQEKSNRKPLISQKRLRVASPHTCQSNIFISYLQYSDNDSTISTFY